MKLPAGTVGIEAMKIFVLCVPLLACGQILYIPQDPATPDASEPAATAGLEQGNEINVSTRFIIDGGSADAQSDSGIDQGDSGVLYNVDSVVACGANGYCSATSDTCGVPDPSLATLFCIGKGLGFTEAAAFTTEPGIVGQNQCKANGSGCYVTANANCSLVFMSISCK